MYQAQISLYQSLRASYTSVILFEGHLDTFDKGTYKRRKHAEIQ